MQNLDQLGIFNFPIFRMELNPRKISARTSTQPSNHIQSQQVNQMEPNKPHFPAGEAYKQNLYLESSIIRSEPRDQLQSDNKTNKSQSSHPEKQIISRETQKKILRAKEYAKRRKAMHASSKSNDLSLIHEESGEYFSSSSQSGQISDLSMEESSSEYEGSQYWKIGNKWSEQKDQSQCEENLDKTILMSKKKIISSPVKAQRIQQQRIQHQILLGRLIQQYPFQRIAELYQQGQIEQIDYKRMLQMKKEQSQGAKQDKFASNMEKIQHAACQIFGKYQHLSQKLMQDISGTELKNKKLQEKYRSMKDAKKNSKNPYDPEKMKHQLKLIEKSCEIRVKRQILQNVLKCFEELRRKYHEHMVRLNEEKQQKQNFSQNLIFREIKEFFKLSHQVYSSILRSLMKNKDTGRSVVSQKTNEYFIQRLQEIHVDQLKRVDEINCSNIMTLAKQSFDQLNFAQLDEENLFPEETFTQLARNSAHKISQGFQLSKQILHENIAFLKMVTQNGELSSGKTYKNAIQLMKIHPPSELTIQNFSQKVFVESFKFFQKKVQQKVFLQLQPLQRLHILIQTRREAKNLKERNQKLSNLIFNVQVCEREALSICTVLSRLEIRREKSTKQNELDRYRKVKDYLNQKVKNFEKLSEKAWELVKEQESKKVHKFLIPKKRVQTFNFRTQKDEPQNQNLPNEPCKSSWQQIFGKMQRKELLLPKTQQYPVKIYTENIGSFFYQDESILIEKNQKRFINQMERIMNKSSSQQTDSEAQRQYLDKVYQMIVNKQVHQQEQQTKSRNQPYRGQNESIFEDLMDSIQLTGWKPSIDISSIYLNPQPKQLHALKDISRVILPNSSAQSNYQWLKKDQSMQDIQNACQLFARDFRSNPAIRESLGLNDHQFYFLMSPEYRRYFMEKKLKDQQLTNKILEIVSLSKHLMNKSLSSNPIKYLIEGDFYFRQKIEEYQHRIVKDQKLPDPNEPRLVYDFDEISTCDDSQEFELLDRRVKEMQDKIFNEYYWRKHQEYGNKDDECMDDANENIRVIYC